MQDRLILRRARAALLAGLLAWLWIYAIELVWTLRDHPRAWIRAYLEAPIPWLLGLYALAALVTAAILFPFLRSREGSAIPGAGRAAGLFAAVYLALAHPLGLAGAEPFGARALIVAAAAAGLALGAAVLLGRLLRPWIVLGAGLIAALVAVGSLAAHALLSRSPERAGIVATRPPANAPDVLLLTIDTLRARNVGAWGYARARTPNIDRLAAQGTRWARAYTPVPQTGPSFATMLTGLHPARHGLLQNGWRLDRRFETLPERLRAAGWKTFGAVSVNLLGSTYGFGQGFDRFSGASPLDPIFVFSGSTGARFSLVDLVSGFNLPGLEASPWNPGRQERRGDLTVDEALRLLRGARTGDRVFLWVHLYDPHQPHRPPAGLLRAFEAAPAGLPPSPLPRTRVRALLDGYDAEVAFADEQVGRLLAGLGPRRDRTLVVFASDHGEALGEHGYVAHANHVSEEILQVPLIFSWPGRIPAGKVDSARAFTMDVTPTLLAALGLEAEKGADGVDLLAGAPARSLFLMTDNPGGRQLRGLLAGEEKLILSWQRGIGRGGWDRARREVYDLARDPGETRNLASQAPARAGRMAAATRAYFARSRVSPQRIDPAARRALEALGYVQ